MEQVKKSVFETLNAVNCNEHTEKKNGLTYLSWAWAWAEVKKRYPSATYTIYENKDGLLYHTDGKTAWVKTGVTIEGIELIEYLPVMNYKNESISLDRLTSFDVNKTIQRSLTKACARHGLGLYIYAGEDLPEGEEAQPVQMQQPMNAVEARRAAAGRSRQVQQPRYAPVSNEVFWKMVANYVTGVPAKSGEDYRTAWINATNAGEKEIAMFDDAVNNYRVANNF
jgi:hypothetical protein